MREIFREALLTGAVVSAAAIGIQCAEQPTSATSPQDFPFQRLQAILPTEDSLRVNSPRLVSKIPKKIL